MPYAWTLAAVGAPATLGCAGRCIATKLLVVMGVRGGGGTLNATAEQLDADAREVERVCAAQSGGL